MTRHDAQALERFLLGGEPPALELLHAAKLTGWAYTRLAADHPLKRQLEAAFVLASAQHAAVRAELLPLLRAWHEAGVEALVFKGFYLAERVYDEPAERFYSDVDILIRPERAEDASRLAQALGWRESWRAETFVGPHGYRDADWAGHEVMHLDASRLRLRLDVHRRILHNSFFWTGLQERMTHEAWRSSQLEDWGGGAVARVLQPADALLIGLVMNRAWSNDNWRLRPHDLLDFAALVRAFGLTRNEVEARAKTLGCARTLRLFLRRCDAFRGHLDLAPPSGRERTRWNLAIAFERGHPALERRLKTALRGPATAADMLRQLPGALAALRLLRQGGLPEAVLEPAAPRPVPSLSYREWRRIRRGVRHDLALLGYPLVPDSLPLTLALVLALRRRGQPAVLRRDPEAAPGEKLWLELHGKRLEDGTRPKHEVA